MRAPLCLALLCVLLAGAASAQDATSTILVVGDSHSAGTFGEQLDTSLRNIGSDRGGKVAFFAVCSSGPNSWLNETEHGCGFLFRDFDKKAPSKWLRTRKGTVKVNGQDREVTFVKTPSLAQLLADYKPQVTLVALGSNPTSAEGVEKMLELIHQTGSACAWIGPPYMRNPPKDAVDKTYDNALKKSGVDPALKLSETKQTGCALIDSRPLRPGYPDKAGDGTHYEATPELREQAKQWARDAAWDFAGRLR